MKNQARYIMRDQVQNLIPHLMDYRQPTARGEGNGRIHLMAIGAVTIVYLAAMAFSG